MSRIIIAAVLVIGSITASATTLLVLPDGSGPYPDLQAAVAAAADGDTILLGDGVFSGAGNRNLILADRSLTFRSQSGNSVVDLEGASTLERRFMQCSGTAADRVTVADLELRNGSVYGSGGCIWAEGVTLVLEACTLRDCRADWWEAGGGAVFVQGGSVVITGGVFAGNRVASYGGAGGGAVATQDAVVVVHGTEFVANIAGSTFDSGGCGGALAVSGGTAVVEGCEFRGNSISYTNMGMSRGGAVAANEAVVELVGCVFVDNEAGGNSVGGAFAMYRGQGTVSSCTFFRNGASLSDYFGLGGSVYAREGTMTLGTCIITGAWGRDWEGGDLVPTNAAAAYLGTITATDCDVWGNGQNWSGPLAGQDGHDGNFAANPCFCDTAAFDFHLCADSWCAPEHNVAHPGVLVGALSVGCEACGCEQGPTAVGGNAEFAVARLLDAAPNPFNPATVIRFSLPVAGPARLVVHDLAGRHVATLVDGPCGAGEQSVTWRGRDDRGRLVAGGTYLLRLEAGDAVVSRKLTLLK